MKYTVGEKADKKLYHLGINHVAVESAKTKKVRLLIIQVNFLIWTNGLFMDQPIQLHLF
jgi:hypothetical protein